MAADDDEIIDDMHLAEVHIHLKDKPSYDDLVACLELMALQYLEHDGVLDHRCMSAGEKCLQALQELDLVKGKKRERTWTEKSSYYDPEGHRSNLPWE